MPPQSNPVLISPIGVVLAMVFLAAIGGTLVWMLRLPTPTPATVRVKRAVRHVHHLEHILVPTHGGPLSDRIVGLAAQVGKRQGARVELLNVQEIPRLFPMYARLPEEEQAAAEAIDRAIDIAESFGVKPVARIVRARDAGPAIVEEAIEQGVDLIMMGSGPPPRPRLTGFGQAADYVFRYAPCEVVLARAPMELDVSPWESAAAPVSRPVRWE